MATTPAFQWKDREHKHRERGADWFWVLGILAAAAAVTSIIFSNVLFAVIIVVAAFTMAMFAAQQPATHTFTIDKRGVAIDSTLYPYQSIESFWVEDRDADERPPRLIINIGRGLLPYLIIPLANTDPDAIRDYLDDRIPEEELHEPFSQIVLEWVGF